MKFIKYIDKEKFDISVVTVSNTSVPYEDLSLIKDIPDGIKQINTRSLEPILLYNLLRGKSNRKIAVGMEEIKETKSLIKKLAKYLRSNIFIPDAKIGWYYNSRRKILQVVKKGNIDVVITTGPPNTTHLFGNYIKKKTSVKWITDFRDPWITMHLEQHLNRSNKAINKNKKYQQEVYQNCDKIITVSDGLKKEMTRFEEKISVIPNGFDIDDIPNQENGPTEFFHLSYIGNLKINQNIDSFWLALADLNENSEFRSFFRLKLIGIIAVDIKKAIRKYQIENIVEIHDFVKHKEAVKLMSKASMLWLPIPNSSGNKSIITGKIFEYLASRTPILFVGPMTGDASKILIECNRNLNCDYSEKDRIKEIIWEQFIIWKKNNKTSPKILDNKHLMFSRQSLTKRLEEIL